MAVWNKYATHFSTMKENTLGHVFNRACAFFSPLPKKAKIEAEMRAQQATVAAELSAQDQLKAELERQRQELRELNDLLTVEVNHI